MNSISPTSYAIFFFLINSNYIFSLSELHLIFSYPTPTVKSELFSLISNFKQLCPKQINIQIHLHFSLPNIEIINMESVLCNFETPSLPSSKLPHIDPTNSTVTINCKSLDEKTICVETLGSLDPNMDLVIENLSLAGEKEIRALLKLVVNGDGTKRGFKFAFRKVKIGKVDLESFIDKNSKAKIMFLKELKEVYDVEMEEGRIEDLMSEETVMMRTVMRDRSKVNGAVWRFYSNVDLRYRRTEVRKRKDGDVVEYANIDKKNHLLRELRLKEFEYYKAKIGMKKPIYESLLKTYNYLCQFQYLDQSDIGTLSVSSCSDSVTHSLATQTSIREITVYSEGEIEESESNVFSSLERFRV